MRKFLLVGALAPALVACVSSGGADAIRQLPSNLAETGRVTDIVLAAPPANGSPEFATVFKAKVGEKLAQCAKGNKPLRLEATLTEFKRANALATWAVGSSNRIAGTAKLIDPADGSVVADYDIHRSVGGGGLIAVAGMSQAEEQMSSAFGDELCKRAFVRR